MSDTFIKTEPDDDNHGGGGSNYYSHHQQHQQGNDLLSRSVLTRGFSSFDEQNNNSSMIDDNDLLDLDGLNSPELNPYSSVPLSSSSNFGPPPPVPPNSHASNAHAMAAASIGFTSNTPTRPIMTGSYTKQLGSTPPVPESTSPFDEFMLANRIPQAQQQQLQQQQQQQQQRQNHLRMSSMNSPRHNDYQRLQGLNSANSTPVGSYEYATSPPMNAAAAAQLKKNNNGTPSSLPPNSPDDKQQMLLAERRRRRRESHNAVERRRRDNINEKIKELAELLPDAFLSGAVDGSNYAVMTKDEKPNKGTILSRSVEYIRHLQNVIDSQNQKELEMRDMVHQLQQQQGLPQTDFGGYTSAELALSKVGTGPAAVAPPNASPQQEMRSPDSQGSGQQQLQQQQQQQQPQQAQQPKDFTSELDMDYYRQNPDNMFSSPR